VDIIYLSLILAFFGATLALVKDWKKKDVAGAVKNNILGIIGFSIVMSGAIIGYLTNYSAVKEKKKSDDTAESRQRRIVKLLNESNSSLKSQLDTTITILNYSKKLNDAQSDFSRLQKEDSHLQSQLYSEVIGGNKIDKSFSISVIVDQKDYLPVIVFYDDHIKTSRLSKYFSLSHPNAEIEGKRIFIGDYPENYQSSIKNLSQIIQYKLIYDLFEIQNSGITFTSSMQVTSNGNTSSVANISSGVSLPQPFKLSKSEKIKWADVLKLFQNRKFTRDVNEINTSKYISLKLPVGTKLALDSSVIKGTYVNYKIVLINHLFKIIFTIKSEGSAGPISSNLGIHPDIAERCKLYTYIISMNGLFYNLKSGIPETAEYKKWADWVFEKLKDINYSN
jgi:hypothetical protein